MKEFNILDWLHNDPYLTPQEKQASKLIAAEVDYQQFKYKQFYCWDTSYLGKRDCCFNHIIGLPEKNGRTHPLYDYEANIFRLIEKDEVKHLWIKKATGLGVSEFFLRYVAWKALSSDIWKNCKVCIVTGPRLELAITLIDRIKHLFSETKVSFESKNAMIMINDCRIEAYPSHHIDTMRGLTNVKLILLDECSFFPPNQQQEVRDVSERYIAKGNPIIVMVSTPRLSTDMFALIEQEP